MRKWNGIISLLLVALLLVHAMAGAYQMIGVLPGGSKSLKILAGCLGAVLCLHVFLGICLTVKTIRTEKQGGAFYVYGNRMFWTRRLSGFAMLFFIVFHVLVMTGTEEEVYRLHRFGLLQLVGSLLLVLTLGIHLLTNIRPLLIGLGAEKGHRYMRDLLFLLSLLLLFCGAAFLLYYLRWNVFWR